MKRNKPSQLNLLNRFKIDINSMKNPVQINSGSFGIVYLVQDKKTEEYYEAKVLNYYKDNLKYRQAISYEIEILICVQHPTIIKFHGYSEKDFEGKNNITIIMGYPTNGTLAGAIKNPQNLVSKYRYDNTARQIILIGIARGMMHLHQFQIVNPCLKPDNILLDDDLQPSLTNFGLSKFFERNHTQDQPTETDSLIYNAPEVITDNYFNSKSDVYSFGILMYEVITESVPYPAFQEQNKMTINQFEDKIVHKDYRPRFKAPIKKSFQRLIERCWSKDLQERPTFEEIFTKLSHDSSKYRLDNVDKERIQSYINAINITNNLYDKAFIEKLKDKLKIVEENNQQLKKLLSEKVTTPKQEETVRRKISMSKSESQLTIDDFNILPLKSQQSILNKISENAPNDSITNLNNLLHYLAQFVNSPDTVNYVRIFTKSPIENSLKLKESSQKFKRIYLLSNATEILYSNKSLESTGIRKILNNFDLVCIELKSPSDSFKELFEVVSNLKSFTKTTIKMALFLSRINEGEEFFKIKTSFSAIRIDTSVTSIPRSAFSGYTALAKVMIPQSVTSIDDMCFKRCKSLEHIEIPPSVRSIGSRCFNECLSLTQVKLPDSVLSIGSNAFRDCLSLQKVELPISLRAIDDCLLSNCTALEEVVIPPSVVSIGDNAFGGCRSLASVTIPSSVTSIGKNAFDGCVCLSSVSIPPSVTSIGWNAFFGCSSLTSISIPSSVSEVKYNVFNGCIKLKQISIDPYKTVTSPHAFDGLMSLNHLVLNESVTAVQRVFYLFQNFAWVTLPESVKTIEKNSFGGCGGLRQINIPSSVKSIGESAFFGCAALKEIHIPSSVTSIGDSAFSGCESLEEVTIPASVKLIGKNAFFGCSKLVQISILSSQTAIGDSAFSGCSSLKQITIYSPVNSIGSGAFSGCSSLMQISIPYAVTSSKYQFLGIDKRVKIVAI